MVYVVILPPPNPTNSGADTDTEDVKNEIFIDSAIGEVSGTLEVHTSYRCKGAGTRKRAK